MNPTQRSSLMPRQGMRITSRLRLAGAVLCALASLAQIRAMSSLESIPAVRSAAIGASVPGAEAPGRLVLANEPEGAAGAILDFDLGKVVAKMTPSARITLDLEKLPVKRPGQSAGVERGAIHLFTVAADGSETLAGSIHVKPGGAMASYPVDVTDAVNRVLTRPAGERKVRFAIRLTGKPAAYEVYALPAAVPSLEIASAKDWPDDWDRRIATIVRGPEVYRESCIAVVGNRNKEGELKLLYPARKVTEMIALGTGERLQEGRDWVLRGGRVVLPPGSHAPVQLAAEFFLTPRKEKDGSVTLVRNTIKLTSGPWYHERQMEVTYEPAARDWTWPAARSSLDQLPRTKKLLQSKAPLKIVLFGDSISAGYDSSRINAAWPYQPPFGDLVIWQLKKTYGAPITFMNHARGGGTSSHALTQVDSQVAWFKPDLVLLAYGMNDRSEERRIGYRENLEKIIDAVRARSPETEFVLITPMLNSPKQATGLDPVKFIRDEGLRVPRPGVAFVDVTSTQLSMLERKDYLDLSGNGANHPNDFLHRIYAQRILEVLAPGKP